MGKPTSWAESSANTATPQSRVAVLHQMPSAATPNCCNQIINEQSNEQIIYIYMIKIIYINEQLNNQLINDVDIESYKS